MTAAILTAIAGLILMGVVAEWRRSRRPPAIELQRRGSLPGAVAFGDDVGAGALESHLGGGGDVGADGCDGSGGADGGDGGGGGDGGACD